MLLLLIICGATQSYAAAHPERSNEYHAIDRMFGLLGIQSFITARTILQTMNVQIENRPNAAGQFILTNTEHTTLEQLQTELNRGRYEHYIPKVLTINDTASIALTLNFSMYYGGRSTGL